MEKAKLSDHTVATAPKDIQNMALVAALLTAGYSPENVSTVFDQWDADGREPLPPIFAPVSITAGALPPVTLGDDGEVGGNFNYDLDPDTGEPLGATWGHGDGDAETLDEVREEIEDILSADAKDGDAEIIDADFE